MNIVIDGHSLQFIGGMERVVCDLASGLAARGHQVFLFTSDSLRAANAASATPVYTLHPCITVVHYTHGGRRKHLAAFRQQILDCAPDVCISSATDRRHWPWCAALLGTGIPLVISEHSVPEAVEKQLWNSPERLAVMAAADGIHLLLPSYLSSLPDFLRDRIRVLPNAVTLPTATPPAEGNPTILSMGRLSWEKQNSLLLDAFALLAENFPQWQLRVWGEGPERGRLAAQIRRQGMEGRAFLCGPTNTPHLRYAEADIVCMPSSYEGFGCVAAEAMTVGLPVVAFARCPGVNEIVQHEVTGLLAPEMTAVSLAESLSKLMADADLRKRLGALAREAAQQFAPAAVHGAWEQFLLDVARHKGKTQLQNLENLATLPPEQRKHFEELARCIARPNVLVGDDQHFRRIIFQFPWIKRALHPLYTWLKTYQKFIERAKLT